MECLILKTGYLTPTTPLSGKIFLRQGGTCYDKSINVPNMKSLGLPVTKL